MAVSAQSPPSFFFPVQSCRQREHAEGGEGEVGALNLKGSQERPVLQEPSTSTWRPPFGAAASSSSDSRTLPQGQNFVPDMQVSEQEIQPIKRLRKDAPPVMLQRGRGSYSTLRIRNRFQP